MSSRRAKRVGELMKEEISDLIQRGLKNPHIGMVTITGVELTNDLGYAKIFISVYGENEKKSPSLNGLRKATGFIRKELSRRIRLRHFPELRFLWDSSIERGEKMSQLLERLECERKSRQQIRDNSDPAA
jgi:ribosome-binding factor A